MALPSSGQISFADLQAEYGGTNPISLSEFRGSNYNPTKTSSGPNYRIADVSFNSNFIDSLFSYLTKRKDFYFIPIFETSHGNVFSRIESNMLSLVTVGSAKLNYPLLSNGAAMLFRKDCFLEFENESVSPFIV